LRNKEFFSRVPAVNTDTQPKNGFLDQVIGRSGLAVGDKIPTTVANESIYKSIINSQMRLVIEAGHQTPSWQPEPDGIGWDQVGRRRPKGKKSHLSIKALMQDPFKD
jgi:hypothetical protein